MNPSTSNARLRPFRPVPFGRYTLLSQLATGGMGEIFLARLEGLQGFEKLCVIKKILPQLAADPEFVERFVGEARTLVKLTHGSIAQVLDMGLHEGEAYMALEYVDGKDLRKVAARARDRQKPLPLTFILFVMGRVLDALAYAHRKKGDDEGELNLVHRDISPQNILISYEGEVKVIDFGLAKSRLSAAKTNPSIILGKFLYMSPEQARHQPVDRRSDLYAVGLCLYELISGRNPFDLLPPGELMSAVVQPSIRPLGEVMPSVPPALAQLVMKALAVEPAQRFQTAEELRGRLNACMLELDPGAGPESVSRYMHELFAPEYQGERKLLASLKEAGRPPEPEPVVIDMPEGAPPRPAATLPPKTIRLDGSVEPLSFRPTPRTRDGGPARDEGETRPAVVVEEPTRPAVAVEAIEESARGRSSSPSPGGSPTVDVSGLTASATPRASTPVPLGASRSITPTREVPVSAAMLRASIPPGATAPTARAMPAAPPPPAPVPIEDTPAWSPQLGREEAQETLEPSLEPHEELSAWDAQAEQEVETREQELPLEYEGEEVLPAEESPPEVDVRLEDTQPRIQLPLPSHDDTQPRISLPDVFHEDTQPRVVLDQSLFQESEEDEVSQGGRPRPGARGARRRTTSTGLPAVPQRPQSSPRMAPVPSRNRTDEDEENTEEAARLPSQEITKRTAMPQRPRRSRVWLVLGLLLLLGGCVAAVLFFMQRQQEQVKPQAPRPLSLPGNKTGSVPPREPAAPAPLVEEPSSLADSAREDSKESGSAGGPDSAAPLEALAADAGTSGTEDAGTPAAAPAGTLAVAPDTEPDTGSLAGTPAPELPMPAPLSSGSDEAPAAAPGKRPSQRGKRTNTISSRAPQSMLQKEWARTRTAYKALTKIHACESLEFLCSRYENLEAEVVGLGDVEDAEVLGKVKALYRDIQKKKSGS
ncbi:serine/threonine protein kinase [Archangium lipolyticum]|uniref:serine/threonine protein kinase n=1 Tax=Archangium lipolyticum TaxID=2970465 RepID=UPI00214A693B|nr:serine/threonine-protein kinase [Archangium lipolyticum]